VSHLSLPSSQATIVKEFLHDEIFIDFAAQHLDPDIEASTASSMKVHEKYQ